MAPGPERSYLRRAGYWLIRLIPFSLLGVGSRIASDALHMPGYYDSLGAMCASSLFGPLPSLLSGLVSGVLLIPYYQVYVLAFWIPGVAALVYGLIRRKGNPTFGALLSSITYVFGWSVVYCLATGTWGSMKSYLMTRGALILYLDVFICSSIGELLSRVGKPSTKVLSSIFLASLALIGVSWIVVRETSGG